MNIKCNNVIDIATVDVSKLSRNTSFYLDTNIWVWLTYVNSNEDDQNENYAAFANEINRNKYAKLLYSHITFSEVTNVIENAELRYYRQSHRIRNLNKKQFRSIPEQRNNVVENIETSLNFVSRTADAEDDFIEILNYISVESYMQMLKTTLLDGNDILMSMFIKYNGVKNVVTDDKDYLGVPGINVFTYNSSAIELAKEKEVNTEFDKIQS